ncbi:hypothetical protein DY000_02059888 [Brassica cretica]|uniref:Uncharacterized protein n=1 Tax=Brassica cretica TaxID=69181 RepID=A0ABQ7AVU2_BRACR|nr:hypothetical protein DY000_02059888 [Brassica cretica]
MHGLNMLTKVGQIHGLSVSFAEDVEVVDIDNDRGEEEVVNFISAVHTSVDRHHERSTPTESDDQRPTHHVEYRSTPSLESVGSCETVRIIMHDEFAARHPYPLTPYRVTMDNIRRQPSPSCPSKPIHIR